MVNFPLITPLSTSDATQKSMQIALQSQFTLCSWERHYTHNFFTFFFTCEKLNMASIESYGHKHYEQRLDPHKTNKLKICEFLHVKFKQGLQHQIPKGYIATISALQEFCQGSFGQVKEVQDFLQVVDGTTSFSVCHSILINNIFTTFYTTGESLLRHNKPGCYNHTEALTHF